MGWTGFIVWAVLSLHGGVSIGAPAPGEGAGAGPTTDWATGQVRAVGRAAPSLRQPGPELARTEALRHARKRALIDLETAVRGLPVGDGRSVDQALGKDSDAQKRWQTLIDGLPETIVREATDGGVTLTLQVSLLAVWGVLDSALAVPPRVAPGNTPDAVVVRIKGKVTPRVQAWVEVGGQKLVAHVAWVHDDVQAKRHERLGTSPLWVNGTFGPGNTVLVESDGDNALERVRKGAQVILVTRSK